MKYSIIVPVFNRPDEVDELLQSLVTQTLTDFEVVIVEDGSEKPCKDVCDKYAGKLDVKYFMKKNSGPGQSRNYGAERAKGEYLIVLDSDVVLPEGYLKAVDDELQREPADAFGGPDRSHDSFSETQKAISYSMTSFFTTGGIRGGKKKLDKFYPRSFNMGIRADIYRQLGGFSKMRYSISNTAEYGDYVTGPKLITEETKKAMKKILSDIQDGTFAKEFLLDMSPAGRQVHFKAMRKLAAEHPSEKVGEEVRKLYSWNDEKDKFINN